MSHLPFKTADDWIQHCFKQHHYDSLHHPSFHKLFLKLIDLYNEEQNINILTQGEDPFEVDDPKGGSYREALEDHLHEVFQHFLAAREEGHGIPYSEAYIDCKFNRSCPNRASADAYRAIGSNFTPSPEDPAYQDCYSACIHQGKSPDFAKKCAELLFDSELSFPLALEKTKQFEDIPGIIIAQKYPEEPPIPNFTNMSEKSFKAYRPKTEKEHTQYEAEASFRAKCRQYDYDPECSDSRDNCRELLSELGDEWWKNLDEHDQAGYSKMMTQDFD